MLNNAVTARISRDFKLIILKKKIMFMYYAFFNEI